MADDVAGRPALGIGAGFTYLLWLNIGTHLTVTTDIVGRTTFAHFDIYRYLERFYDIAFVLPASSAIAYVLLHFFGPLRATPPARPWPPLLEVVDPVDDVELGVTSLTDTDDALTSRQLFWTVVRVGLVALVVGIESNIARSPHETVVTTFAFAIAALTSSPSASERWASAGRDEPLHQSGSMPTSNQVITGSLQRSQGTSRW